VPQSDVPGEVTSKTQPIPTLPEPFERQGVTRDSLNNLTPEILAEAQRIASRYRSGPTFTPPSVVTGSNAGTLQVPGSQGGSNWQGAVADPVTGMLYVSSTSTITYMGLVSEPERSNLRFILAGSRITGPFGLPLARPPWGTINALDMNTGKRLWSVPNGDAPDYVRKHEKLRGVTLRAHRPATTAPDCWSRRHCCSPARAPACSSPRKVARSSARTTSARARSSGKWTWAQGRPGCR
jgi:quinoprotein glucose dehydrogenase